MTRKSINPFLILGIASILVLTFYIVQTSIKYGIGFYSYYDELQVFHSGKTLWDWMQLLIVPVALGLTAIFFNIAEKSREREIEVDRTREYALQNYFDQIEKLVANDLKKSVKGDDKRQIARSRTLSVLRTLDGKRKGILLQFLYDLGLILRDTQSGVDNPIISLTNADLRGLTLNPPPYFTVYTERSFYECHMPFVDLEGADLRYANLYGVFLVSANLKSTNFSHANLVSANLYSSCLEKANFEKANLSGAQLYEAILYNCHLRGANLSGANLLSSKLYQLSNGNWDQLVIEKADLTHANLYKANLWSAEVMPDQLRKAKYLRKAIMPNDCVYDGKYSLFDIKATSQLMQNADGMGTHFEFVVDAFCTCGEKFSNFDDNNALWGLWYGLSVHRIKCHKHKVMLSEHEGGIPFQIRYSNKFQ